MTDVSPILTAEGRPMPRASASAALTAHQAADPVGQELASWFPASGSADRDVLGDQRLIVDRIRDLERNDGWVSGAITRELDQVIGYNFRPEPKPDADALGISEDAAAQLGDQMEREWTLWANDPMRYCDATRHDNWHGLAGLMYRHRARDGESLAVLLFRPRGGRYGTCLKVVDPDRLSNPHGMPNDDALRAGVALDADGAAIGYWIRKGHPRDVGISVMAAMEWDYVQRETPWGRPIVIHDFERRRADQHRGLSDLVGVVKNQKMAQRYQGAELQTAVMNALLAAFIESPFDHEFLMEMLGDSGGEKSFEKYQGKRSDFHDKRGISVGGVKIPALFPGEKIGFFNPTRPSAQMESFLNVMLRNMAAARPVHTAESVSLDYSRVNYSSARAAMLVAARSVLRERMSFGVRTGSQVYHAVMEEGIRTGRIQVPAAAPDFLDAREAYLACDWMGPAQGWVDPVKEAQGAEIRMDAGLSSLMEECAAQGKDWRDVLKQRSREQAYAVKLGLPAANRERNLAVVPPSDIEDAQAEAERQRQENGEADGQDAESLKEEFDLYGIGVRAGVITPQVEDEEAFRTKAGLPAPSAPVKQAWAAEPVRRPITLAIAGGGPSPGVQDTEQAMARYEAKMAALVARGR